MSTEALIIRNDQTFTIDFTREAARIKEQALTASAGIGKVTDTIENAAAVEAQIALANVIKLIEQARKACKEPVLAFGKKIDEQAKAFVQELTDEQWRISRLVGDFQQLEQKKAQAAARQEQERLSALERERQQAIAQAKSHDELDEIEARHDLAVKQQAPQQPVAPPRAQGQRVVEEIKFEVFDIDALYRSKPNCVKMEPKKLEITALLKAGLQLPGVRSWTETKATVSTRTSPAIDV